jgi:23S rRNA pseudouridine1911/1915/1917 synthase
MVERFTTTPEDKGQRLDRFIHGRLADVSRTSLRRIIDLGGVHVDGRRVRKAGLVLEPGQHIELHRDHGPLDPYRILDEEVLFEDAYLVAINKAAGLDTQPTPARYKGTLYEALQVRLKRDRRFGRRLEIGMVQRLDRGTSGVIVFSIHPRAHKGLAEQFGLHTVRKHYLALVQGCPDPASGSCRSQLIRDRRSGLTRSSTSGGKEAISHYRVLRTNQRLSLLQVELVTGRTHQIRAQLAEAGHPLLGDIRYGGPGELDGRRFVRQCLHAQRLELTHPVSGAPLLIEAPVPVDMAIAIA